MSGRLLEHYHGDDYRRGDWVGALSRFRGSQIANMEYWDRMSDEESATMAVHTVHVVPYQRTNVTTVSSLDPNDVDQGSLGYVDSMPYDAGGVPLPLILRPVPCGRGGFATVGARGGDMFTRTGGNPAAQT